MVGSASLQLEGAEAEVVDAIRRRGPLTRTFLADQMGLSRAKITGVVAGLIEREILLEVGPGVSRGGRRPRLLDLNGAFGLVAGVEIGATSLGAALADLSGNVLQRASESTDVRDGPEAVLGRVQALVHTLLERSGVPSVRLLALGAGIPAPVNFREGHISAPPMADWEGYPIQASLRQHLNETHVIIDNDANIMALAELRSADDHPEDFIFLKIGTGIGAGIVVGGRLYRGSSGYAGEVGHICIDPDGPICPRCGNIGCLEALAAGPAIAARGAEAARLGQSDLLSKRLKTDPGPLTAEDVAAAAAGGDRASIQIFRDSGRMIGEALAGMVNFFNPRLVVIGGGVSQSGPLLLSSIRQAVFRRSHPQSTKELRIEYSKLGANAGVQGAVALALDHVFMTDGNYR